MPKHFLSMFRAVTLNTDEDDVMRALQANAGPLRVLALWRKGGLVTEFIRPSDVTYHPDVDAGFRATNNAHALRYGPSVMAHLADTDPLPFTFSEALRKVQPVGEDRWVFDHLNEHGIRDGLLCPCGPWRALFTSDHVLKNNSALSRETRMALDATVGVAVYRLSELVERDKLIREAALSPRELTVLRRVSVGERTPAIAAALGLSEASVKTYAQRAQKKLTAKTLSHAVALAVRRRLI